MAYEDFEIFDNKTLSSVLKDIYTNSKEKKDQIDNLIGELSPLITTIEDATMLVPVIKDYLEVSVKNDKQLIDLTNVIQKLVATEKRVGGTDGDGFGLSDFEKQELLKMAEDGHLESIQKKDDELQREINKVQSPIGKS